MDLSSLFDQITPDFIKNQNLNFRAVKEVMTPIIQSSQIDMFKFTTSINEQHFIEVIYNLPLSFEIIDNLTKNQIVTFTDKQKVLFQREVSLYIFVSTIIRLKRKYVSPLLVLLYNREGNLRLTGPFMLFSRKIAKEEGENLDRESISLTSYLDALIRNNLDVIESDTKIGRPANRLEDEFIGKLRDITKLNKKYFHEEIASIIEYLKTEYNNVFSELPLSREAIKKSLLKLKPEITPHT